jgi:curli biogenesis system outer membrane secretion channel CsgG
METMNTMMKTAIGLVTALVLAGCAGTNAQVVSSSSNAPTISQAQQAPVHGEQRRIAVSRFDMRAGPDVGMAMADFLTDSLFNSGRFIVLERARLDEVRAEQAMQSSPEFRQDTAAEVGQFEGAELIIRGAVVAFEPSCKGTSVLLAGSGTACITMNLRIIDVETGRVVNATTVEATSRSNQVGFFFARGSLPVGLGTYNRTPMETALRNAMETAVRHIVETRL